MKTKLPNHEILVKLLTNKPTRPGNNFEITFSHHKQPEILSTWTMKHQKHLDNETPETLGQ